MAKRKKRVVTAKKKKTDASDDVQDELDKSPSAKKVAASSTSFSEDDASQNSCVNAIGASESSVGFSSHYWCNYCEFSADTKPELITHMRQHMIRCSYCSFNSLSRAEVTKHVKLEHEDEVEVDSSSSSTDHDMDKDPCCACIFCDFMTYSTEYLEKHTIAKHRGMLPKSVAKMISKSVSAKVRKADALFYSALSNDQTEETNAMDLKDQDIYNKSESPSSSNTIIIEGEENKPLNDIKPHIKDLPSLSLSNKYSSSPHIISCVVKKPPVEEGQAVKMPSKSGKTSLELINPPAPDWRVKVETMYCLCCPYSNVAIDKLKCHTFSQHPKGVAIAKNNAGEAAHDLSDVTFFCVKESCNHSTNTCVVYEEHIMSCFPLHITQAVDVMERLKSTLNYLSEFHKKHYEKAATGFLDFVSSFNKINSFKDAVTESSTSNSVERKWDPGSMDDSHGIRQTGIPQNRTSYLPQPTKISPVHETPVPNIGMVSNTSSFPSNIISNLGNMQHIHSGFSNDNSKLVQPPSAASQDNVLLQRSQQSSYIHQNESHNPSGVLDPFQVSPHGGLHPQQTDILHPQIMLHNQSANTGGERNQSKLPPPPSSQYLSHSISASLDQRRSSSGYSHGLNQEPSLNISPDLCNSQVHQSHVVFQNDARMLSENPPNFISNQALNTHAAVQPLSSSNSEPFISNDKNGGVNPNARFNSSQGFPAAALTPQQFQPAGSNSINTKQMYSTSAATSSTNPPKMLDLLSNSNSILLDDDLDLNPPVENQMSGYTPQQPTISNPLAPDSASNLSAALDVSEINSIIPMSRNPLEAPTGSSHNMQGTIHHQPAMSFTSVVHQPQQSMASGEIPHQSGTQNVVPQQLSLIDHSSGTVFEPKTTSISDSATPTPLNHDLASLPNSSYPTVSMQQYTNEQQTKMTNLQQSSEYASTSSQPQTMFSSEHILLPSQATGMQTSQEHQSQSQSFIVEQTPATSSAIVPGNFSLSWQTNDQNPLSENLNSGINDPPSSPPSFLQTSSSSGSTHAVQSWPGNQTDQAAAVPNFLVSTSQRDNSTIDLNQPSPNPISLSDQETQQPQQMVHPGYHAPLTANDTTPVKNQSIHGAKNVAGNSPLSPSIYLNGQAPRHNRSNWSTAGMMPRGANLPQIRPMAAAPMNYPGPGNVRQNLFPPYQYRGRGRARGPRMQHGPLHPVVRPHDDDVIVTAVVRGPAPQLRGRPVNRRGLMRGQRPPMPRGAAQGMLRHPVDTSLQAQARKPFDVSKHFVDLACVVNTSNDGGGEDEIQIMGVTPGQSASIAAPKVVDAKKFSFCCVHCGQDQGSKQIMKQHMKVHHNESLLGAFRNVETGQLLFFCPKIRCEFMTYDDKRLSEHLFTCYDLDKSKQLPLDLQSAIKNLRSLKIRKIQTNTPVGGTQRNPIQLDGQGLRDTFNNNLKDAFGDMVENTIGRNMSRPPGNTQPTIQLPPNQPPGRPPSQIRPQIGRPFASTGSPRMHRPPHYQPRQPHVPQTSPGQPGISRMPYHQQGYRMRGRGNFRHPRPMGPMQPVRGGHGLHMTRPPMRGPRPNPKPFTSLPAIGNEGEPILIDIDADSPEAPPLVSQNSMVSANDQSVSSITSVDMSPELSVVPDMDQTVVAATFQTTAIPLPYHSLEATSTGTSNTYTEADQVFSQVNSNTVTMQDQINQNETCTTAVIAEASAQGECSVSNQSVAETTGFNATLEDEHVPAQSSEEQVNAILLEKVFAKVPHMPKKLSQRLVLRFKEFAAKRGVVITLNSKVIDEFVDRISYKGSNPLSKQPQQSQLQRPQSQQSQQQYYPQQNQPEQNHQQQQYHSQQNQPEHEEQQQQYHSLQQQQPEQNHHQQQKYHSRQQQPEQNRQQQQYHSLKQQPEHVQQQQYHSPQQQREHQQQYHSLPQQPEQNHQQQQYHSLQQQPELEQQQQQYHSLQQQPEHEQQQEYHSLQQHPEKKQQQQYQQYYSSVDERNNFQFNVNNQPVSENSSSPLNLNDDLSLSGSHNNVPYKSSASQQFQNDPNTSQYQYQGQAPPRISEIRSGISENQNQLDTSQNQNRPQPSRPIIPQTQNQIPSFQNQNQQQQSMESSNISDSWNRDKDDCDIIETKVILAERDLKFSGPFANIVKSVMDHGKCNVTSGYNSPTSSASPLGSVSGNSSEGNSQNTLALGPSAIACGNPNPNINSRNPFAPTESERVTPTSFSEQIIINEKLLKKEPIMMNFPATRDGESILVQSSVDHIVSGNESLEVDIAGTPLYSDNFFSEETRIENIRKGEEHGMIKYTTEKDKPKVKKDQYQIIDRSSGKIILKVKKGVIQRKRSEEKNVEMANAEEQIIRRSERKRKVLHCEADKSAMDELELLLSDDDDEYQVESEDDSYDGSDYEKGHSHKKKSKIDPDAFNTRQKGSHMCWICLKKFSLCLSVKRHLLKIHSAKALCAVFQGEADGPVAPSQLELLLYCPKKCKYVTSKPDVISHHIAKCQQSEMENECEDQDPVKIQNDFIMQDYVELQESITSGALAERMKQKHAAGPGKRKRQASSTEKKLDANQDNVLITPTPTPIVITTVTATMNTTATTTMIASDTTTMDATTTDTDTDAVAINNTTTMAINTIELENEWCSLRL